MANVSLRKSAIPQSAMPFSREGRFSGRVLLALGVCCALSTQTSNHPGSDELGGPDDTHELRSKVHAADAHAHTANAKALELRSRLERAEKAAEAPGAASELGEAVGEYEQGLTPPPPSSVKELATKANNANQKLAAAVSAGGLPVARQCNIAADAAVDKLPSDPAVMARCQALP